MTGEWSERDKLSQNMFSSSSLKCNWNVRATSPNQHEVFPKLPPWRGLVADHWVHINKWYIIVRFAWGWRLGVRVQSSENFISNVIHTNNIRFKAILMPYIRINREIGSSACLEVSLLGRPWRFSWGCLYAVGHQSLLYSSPVNCLVLPNCANPVVP